MEARLFWMAESPSEDPMDAWGHMGSVRIDGVPSPGCDGNLAGGYGNSGATVASKWWDSSGAPRIAVPSRLLGRHRRGVHPASR